MKPISQPVRKPRKPQGFALVVTLTLMVLLTLLAVGLLSLSAVTLRADSRNSAPSEARANAKMALMVAIGELQKEMGPDQRISVTADQRMASDGDGEETSVAPGNMYWTGVYDSWRSDVVDRPTPQFRSWLVSGASSLVSQPNLPDTATSGAGSVELVAPGKSKIRNPLGSKKTVSLPISLSFFHPERKEWEMITASTGRPLFDPPRTLHLQLGFSVHPG